MRVQGDVVTILFTDLVNSTELMQRAGDEDAQRVLKAHYQLLRDAVVANGGAEVKSLGDGLMVAFASAAEAVRCAVTMQQSSWRRVRGERLSIRVGLNAGEAMRDEGDYFGTPVVIARRLCDRAGPGQILCTAVVESLLAGRHAFSFRDLGVLDLKGIATPVEIREVAYDTEQTGAVLTRTPFVGRVREMARLQAKFEEARASHGSLVMLVGEPGIGKTRTIEEMDEHAQGAGARVLAGRCFEGEWAPPYGPFAEAIAAYAKEAEPDSLLADLGHGAPAIARLVPVLRDRLPDIGDPAPLQPDEEGFRLLDAVSQFLIALSARAPVVLVLDDLHWADRGTLAMLRHVSRFLPRQRILVLAAYRDVELDRQHPLADALAALRGEVGYERLSLKGLDEEDVRLLLTNVAEQEVPPAFAQAISTETDGNPFFIREVLIHLADEGKIYQQDGRWTPGMSIAEMGIPEGVRQVIGRRLSRLSEPANRLLAAASAFNGPFSVDLVGAVAGLGEADTLDAIDEALGAQLVRPEGAGQSCDFTHALIRHTLYGELSPPRQVRLHRKIAEAMEATYGSHPDEHAAELAYQYHRSSPLPGAERGVEHALIAAYRAEDAYAREDAATFLRIALELMPDGDARRPRLLGRLALALAWTLDYDGALNAARAAGDLIAQTEGSDLAADYLAEATRAMFRAGSERGAWALAEQGLRYVSERRDITWAWLKACDLWRREAEDPDDPGIPLDTPERREIAEAVKGLPLLERPPLVSYPSSRQNVLEHYGDEGSALLFWGGEFRRSLPIFLASAVRYEEQGQIANATLSWALSARCHAALGDFAAGRDAYRRGETLAARLQGRSMQVGQLGASRFEVAIAMNAGLERGPAEMEPLLQQPAAEDQWSFANIRSIAAVVYARLGMAAEAKHWLATLVAPLERAPGWAGNYTAIACDAAAALWSLESCDNIDVVERNLREKVVAPDLRYPMRDARLSLARLCALQGRHDEATDWFAKARTVLDEQGARPLRAIVDYDDALMYARRGADGDREVALSLLEVALAQFRELGMIGWIQRGDELRASLA